MASVKIRYQVGAESFVKGKRTFRLTPADGTFEVPDIVGLLLLSAQSQADARDSQPNDGEIDFPIKVSEDILKGIPALKSVKLLPGEQNLFLRLTAA